ncbi:hypothetical protein KR200_005201, partial [Drosophila serrata]
VLWCLLESEQSNKSLFVCLCLAAGSSTLKVRSGNKSVVVLNSHRLYSVEGTEGSKPTNFMDVGPIGVNDQGHPQKGTATTELRAPPTIVGKLGKIEPLETCVNFKDKCDEGIPSEGQEKQEKQSDNQKKAKEAQDAAAKKLQDIVANLPSKQQTEKYFFRVVAFAYDLTYLTGTWVLHFIDQNIIQNDKVQHYWKRFHEKMEQAKKD